MFIRWLKYRSVALWHQGEPPITRVKAVLVESVRINGKPRQRHIAFIESYQEGKIDQISARCNFWRRARERLKEIKLTAQQRRQIEAMLAQRVKPTTALQDAAFDREMKEMWRRLQRRP
jgi:hypothetical protein